MARERWKLTADGTMDTWGKAPRPDPTVSLLAWLAEEPGSGIYEVAPGWYSSHPGERTEDGLITHD